MDRFRLRTGELLGILGPGFFLVVDLFLVLTNKSCSALLLKEGGYAGLAKVFENSVAAIFGLFMLCYVLGLGLRLIPPGVLDWWSGRLRSLKPGQTEHGLLALGEEFPYVGWFHGQFNADQSKNEPHHISDLQDDLDRWKNEENAEIQKARINSLKLFILKESPGLSDEILFAEGSSRLVPGLAYATLICGAIAVLRIAGRKAAQMGPAGLPEFFLVGVEIVLLIWGLALLRKWWNLCADKVKLCKPSEGWGFFRLLLIWVVSGSVSLSLLARHSGAFWPIWLCLGVGAILAPLLTCAERLQRKLWPGSGKSAKPELTSAALLACSSFFWGALQGATLLPSLRPSFNAPWPFWLSGGLVALFLAGPQLFPEKQGWAMRFGGALLIAGLLVLSSVLLKLDDVLSTVALANLVLFMIFTYLARHVRVREAFAVLHAYSVVKNTKSTTDSALAAKLDDLIKILKGFPKGG